MNLFNINLAAIGTTQLVEESKKLLSNFQTLVASIADKIPVAYKANYDEAYASIGTIPVITDFNILPVAAHIEIPYEGDTTVFTITALDKSIAGEDINIEFVDPEDISQDLAISYVEETNTIVISHATDVNGDISTMAGSLETAINDDVVVNLLVVSTMGDAGTVDYVGTVALTDWESGIVATAGDIFTDETSIYIVLNTVDGITNETTDFKKVTLEAL